MSISDEDLVDIALGGLHSYLKEKLEGFDCYTLNTLQCRAMNQEYRFRKAKESCKAHQSNTHVDCESKTSDDEKKENNSDIDNNSVMLRTESNKDCSEFIVSKETSPAVRKHVRSNKIAVHDFSKAKYDVHLIMIIALLSNIFWLRKV